MKLIVRILMVTAFFACIVLTAVSNVFLYAIRVLEKHDPKTS